MILVKFSGIKDGQFYYRYDSSECIDTFEKSVEYIKKYSGEDYMELREKIFNKMQNNLLKNFCIVFLLHCILSYYIYFAFSDYHDLINEKIYFVLSALKIPVHSPRGWNFPYLFSLVFAVYLFFDQFFRKENKALIMPGILKRPFRFYIRKVFQVLYGSLCICMVLYVAYIAPDKANAWKLKCRILWDFCFIRSEDMFFFTIFTTMVGFLGAFIITYIIIFEPRTVRSRINRRIIHD